MRATDAPDSGPEGDEPLLAALAADLDGAFAEFVGAYAPIVYSLALRLAVQPADAEDLASEVFSRAYRALRAYPADRLQRLRPRPWLVTITLNLWRNEARAAARRPRLVPLDESVRDRADAAPGPEQRTLSAGAGAELAALLGTLPDAQRTAVVLRHVLELPYEEIAAATGQPVGTVKSHVSRGLATLRAAFRRTEGVTA